VHVASGEPCPLPDHPVLAEAAAALNAARTWAIVLDHEWRVVFMSDEIRLSNGGLRQLAPWVLAETGLDPVDPRRRDLFEGVAPVAGGVARTFVTPGFSAGVAADSVFTVMRLRDAGGELAGLVWFGKPPAGMSVFGNLASIGDLEHFERVRSLARSARRPAAILFGDLESSSPLARRLSTASYFALGRRLRRAADQCLVRAGGMVGRHAGDGVVGFFLAEHAGSDSAAARACIAAMHELRLAVADVAARSGLGPDDVVLRFGLHWGSTLHIGQISTPARSEVDALGDEMNEAARIETCATGGRALASKALVERLEPDDAAALALAPERVAYTPLGELPTATEKARRDAPAIAVCEL
jgi:class 3 adenylate cyclase